MLIYSPKIINTTTRNPIKRIKEIEMILKKIVKTGVKKKEVCIEHYIKENIDNSEKKDK